MLKHIKATTPGQRHIIKLNLNSQGGLQFTPLNRRKNKQSASGRNNSGQITVRHRCNSKKKFYRKLINGFIEIGLGIVNGIQYDSNRTGRLALRKTYNKYKIRYKYTLAAEHLKVGDVIQYGDTREIGSSLLNGAQWLGSTRKFGNMLHDLMVFNVGVISTIGSQYLRSSGNHGTLNLDVANRYVLIRLKSNKLIKCTIDCIGTIGIASGIDHLGEQLGKAGSLYIIGRRPTVRGEVINPVDHPHGGRTRGGRAERTSWSKLAKGKPTRNKAHQSKWFIL